MARDGEVIQRQYFCHHGGTNCHRKSSYVIVVITKLYGTSTCGCNNNAIFSDRTMFTFLATLNWPRQSIGGGYQSSEMAALLNALSFAFTNSFLPKYRVKRYDYIVKWCSGI